MPYDRMPPDGFALGASKAVKMEMQRLLKSFGYYDGKIDGVLGRGSRAALDRYYDDVAEELWSMSASEIGDTIAGGQTEREINNRPAVQRFVYLVAPK